MAYRTRSDTLKLQRLIDVLKERGSETATNLETSASDFLNDVKVYLKITEFCSLFSYKINCSSLSNMFSHFSQNTNLEKYHIMMVLKVMMEVVMLKDKVRKRIGMMKIGKIAQMSSIHHQDHHLSVCYNWIFFEITTAWIYLFHTSTTTNFEYIFTSIEYSNFIDK